MENRLKKVLNSYDILALAFGAAIGWSWVVLSGDWLKTAGTIGAVGAFVLGGFMVVVVGLTYAELTSAMPKCGGEHVFSKRALGKKWSFVCTWFLILGYIGVTAFEACALPSVAQYLFPKMLQGYMYTIEGNDIYLTYVLIGSGCACIITMVNYFGVKTSSFLQSVLTGAIILTAVILLISGLRTGNPENTKPYFSNGFGGTVSLLVSTPFLLMGFDVIPQAAEEINVPPKKIGKIIVLSIVMSVLFYACTIVSVSLILSNTEINTASLVTADALKKAWNGNQIGSIVLIVGGMAGIISSWNAFLLGGSRCVFAMAESNMLPSWFAYIHPKYKTPSNAVLAIGLLSAIAPFFGRSMLVWVSNAGSFGITIAYMLVALSFVVLRKNEPDLPRPYTVKNGRIVGILAVATTIFMLILYMPGFPSSMNAAEWSIVLGWTVLGFLLCGMKYFAKK